MLLQSGICPKPNLEDLKISVQPDMSDAGINLQDYQQIFMFCKSPELCLTDDARVNHGRNIFAEDTLQSPLSS